MPTDNDRALEQFATVTPTMKVCPSCGVNRPSADYAPVSHGSIDHIDRSGVVYTHHLATFCRFCTGAGGHHTAKDPLNTPGDVPSG